MSPETLTQSIASLKSLVAVVRADGHYRVVATQAVAAGGLIFRLEGVVVDTPSRYSVQIGRDRHLESPPGETQEEALDRRPWRFLNHSCTPNAYLRGRDLIALRPIAAWDQITFDYNGTEDRLSSPFLCSCGAPNCCGEVRGFGSLTAAERALRLPYLAAHLRDSSARDGTI